MSGLRWKKSPSGFTLLEVLLAIAIFAIVISMVYEAYRSTFFNINGAQQQLSATDGARVVMERLSGDLESLYVRQGGTLKGERGDIGGQRADSLSFTSTSHLVFNPDDPRAGLTVIRYHVEEDQDTGLMRLYRSDTPEVPGETASQGEDEGGEVLAEGLKEFRLTYVGADGSEQDAWDSKERAQAQAQVQTGNTSEMAEFPVMPAMIRVELQFAVGQDGGQLVVFTTAIAPPPNHRQGDEG